MTLYNELVSIVGEASIQMHVDMAANTTFRIGGPADYFIEPKTTEILVKAMNVCRQQHVPYFVMGNGSNLLVGDGGFRGVVFHLCKTMDDIVYEEKTDTLLVEAGAGVMLAKFAKEVSEKGYTGFEFATGIPGTLGGGVTMNAGAYGGEIVDHILWADAVNRNGIVRRFTKEELHLSYRHSVVMEEELIIVRAGFEFPKGDLSLITARVAELAASRREKQPLEYPSAGSTFKRPEGYFAGKLIQDAGLKGYTVGGAQISEKHSGFVINRGGATAKDVCQLVKDVQDKVWEQFGVMIELEVRKIGDFQEEEE